MPSIKDRIGSQIVIRVLSIASAPPSKLIILTDVESTSQVDGNLLIWDSTTKNSWVTFRQKSVFTGGTSSRDSNVFRNYSVRINHDGAVIISEWSGSWKKCKFCCRTNVVGIATFSTKLY